MRTQIKYNLKENTFRITSEVKEEHIKDIIGNVLRAQIGTGSDERKSAEKTEYIIIIDLELEDDTFKVSSDTGNKSLTTGILMQLLQEYGKEKNDLIIYE